MSGAGHQVVYCEASPGCRPVWYQPRCEPGSSRHER